ITNFSGVDGAVVIRVFGRIVGGDAEGFAGAVKQVGANGKSIERIELDSPGGSLSEGARMALLVKASRISTSVPSRGVCASACFLVFAAGAKKFAGPGARIGVHKASEAGGRETLTSADATHAMARFARELGVPSWVVERMQVTSAKQI